MMEDVKYLKNGKFLKTFEKELVSKREIWDCFGRNYEKILAMTSFSSHQNFFIGFVFVFQPKATFRSEINEEPIPSLALRMTNSVLSQSKNPFRCEATGVSPVLQSHGCYIFF